jgi:tetratricopeptide (TPR) repeat protein
VVRRLVICGLLVIASFQVSHGSPQELFTEGNQYFEARKYDSAIITYAELLAGGSESAPAYFNLGNAYFRSGDIGHAILYYLRAQRLDPADDDITANLEFARRYTSIQMEGVRLNPVSSFFETLVGGYRLDSLAWSASLCFVLFAITLMFRYGLNYRGLLVRSGITISLLLLLVASLLTTVKYNFDYLTRRGVVIAETCVVHTGPSVNSEKELDAAPGLIVQILGESGDFYNVLFENKRRGWIQKELVSVV